MHLNALRGTRYLALVLSLALIILSGCAISIDHSKVVEPAYQAKISPDISKIGTVTSIKEHGGTLYVGAQNGIAAMDPSGQVLWMLDLPQTGVRLIDADAENVAFTSYTSAGTKFNGLKSILIWGVGDKRVVTDVTVGLATSQGKLLWSVESKEKTALSPPALSKNAIGVVDSMSFTLYGKNDGGVIKNIPMEYNMLGFGRALAELLPTTRPAVINDDFYVTHSVFIIKVNEGGKLLKNTRKYGAISGYGEIVSGPIVFNNLLCYTNEDGSHRIFAADADVKLKWIEKFKDDSAAGSIAANHENVFVATNFRLFAFDKKGNMVWEAKDGGGLEAGAYRGVRYVQSIASQKYPNTQQMVATDRHVYITSRFNKNGDAVTVLNAKTGEYVESINVKGYIFDMAVFGSNLAVATSDGLRLVAIK